MFCQLVILLIRFDRTGGDIQPMSIHVWGWDCAHENWESNEKIANELEDAPNPRNCVLLDNIFNYRQKFRRVSVGERTWVSNDLSNDFERSLTNYAVTSTPLHHQGDSTCREKRNIRTGRQEAPAAISAGASNMWIKQYKIFRNCSSIERFILGEFSFLPLQYVR